MQMQLDTPVLINFPNYQFQKHDEGFFRNHVMPMLSDAQRAPEYLWRIRGFVEDSRVGVTVNYMFAPQYYGHGIGGYCESRLTETYEVLEGEEQEQVAIVTTVPNDEHGWPEHFRGFKSKPVSFSQALSEAKGKRGKTLFYTFMAQSLSKALSDLSTADVYMDPRGVVVVLKGNEKVNLTTYMYFPFN